MRPRGWCREKTKKKREYKCNEKVIQRYGEKETRGWFGQR